MFIENNDVYNSL